MVKLKLKVGPKGQIVIPKILREAYRIKGTVMIEAKEEGILIKGVKTPEEVAEWILNRKKEIKGKKAKLDELAHIDLEDAS